MTLRLETVRTEGLGDSTFVLSLDGNAVVVDPQRDFDRVVGVLDALDAAPRAILETHVHNDYLSGGLLLAKESGAELVMPAGAAPVFRHRPAFHMEDVDVGAFTVRPLHTPGHTPEHTSYLILIEGKPYAVFSGGSLLVGSAGRSDLLGQDRAETLARLQYLSVNRLAALPGDVVLCPTHGSGSFCTSSAAAGEHTSTIGAESRTNPVLAHPDEDSFVKAQLSGLVPFPAYYRHMAPANLRGANPLPSSDVPRLSEGEFEEIKDDVTVIDARPLRDFASGHLPGSVGISHRDDFGVWTGWVLPFDAPVVLVLNPDQDADELARQLIRIGYDSLLGIITDIENWSQPLAGYETADVARFADAVARGEQILDVRAPNEWESGVIRGSILKYAPDVAAAGLGEADPARELWIACETGYRATVAASFAESAGLTPVVALGLGIEEILGELERRGETEWRAQPALVD